MILVAAVVPKKGEQFMTRHRNSGLRKRCGCPRKVWPKCPHSWFLSFKPRGGPPYRLSLDRELGPRRSQAETEATKIQMFNWAVRKGYIERTPFKIGSEPAISLERELPRNRRFQDVGDEQRLLDAANPLLRGVIVAMLDTACRPGEILSLQWREVNLERRELTIRAEKEKTRRVHVIPISS